MPYRILVAHNRYQVRGGEDAVAEAEVALLQAYGHEVFFYVESNDDINRKPMAITAVRAVWSSATSSKLAIAIGNFRPDIIHVHNTFPLISPSLYWTAAKFNIPVVQTLHNFRLFCPQGMLLRGKNVCEECVGVFPWRAVAYGCYRESALGSAVLASTIAVHRGLRTYERKIDRYIALNEFCRQKFIEGGVPAEKIRVKPNFIDDKALPGSAQRHGALFVGRLSAEKGLEVLAAAARQSGNCAVKIIGGGELLEFARATFKDSCLGPQPLDTVLKAMQASSFLVMPSIWYENFPRTVVEAYASSLPVIASRIGALAEIIEDGKTGLLFNPGDADDLAKKMAWASSNPEEMARMGRLARVEYEKKYTAEKNYGMLLSVYDDALSASRSASWPSH